MFTTRDEVIQEKCLQKQSIKVKCDNCREFINLRHLNGVGAVRCLNNDFGHPEKLLIGPKR